MYADQSLYYNTTGARGVRKRSVAAKPRHHNCSWSNKALYKVVDAISANVMEECIDDWPGLQLILLDCSLMALWALGLCV